MFASWRRRSRTFRREPRAAPAEPPASAFRVRALHCIFRKVAAFPSEQSGRKLRRVMAASRPPWKDLMRVWIRLDHLAIEVPGRMPEHRNDHGQPEEQRQG